MMPTLIRLFQNDKAADNFPERCRRVERIVSVEVLLFSISLLSVGVKEKNAVSDAETNPERHNNTITPTKATITPVEIVEN
jgi:hypothetical protein